MVEIIIWGVVWFVLIPIGTWLIVIAGTLIGGLMGDDIGATFGLIVGWILAGGWWIFCVVQVVLHIVALIQVLQ